LRIVWNQRALDDRDASMEYVAKDSLVAAIEMDEEDEQQVDTLAAHPLQQWP
jgi:plasmid stabilization system protein ParE